jgi:hypothetical protein
MNEPFLPLVVVGVKQLYPDDEYYVINVSEELKSEYDFYTVDGKTYPNDIYRSNGQPVLWSRLHVSDADRHQLRSDCQPATPEEVATGITVNDMYNKGMSDAEEEINGETSS